MVAINKMQVTGMGQLTRGGHVISGGQVTNRELFTSGRLVINRG